MKYLAILLMFMLSLQANEKVILQLKWLHQFQFAGYYAAKEKGYYDEVGLDVEIRQRDLNKNNIEQVINQKAQYGIADSILFLYKAKKQPIKIVSPIFQHSPGVIITLKSSGIDSPYKLQNKKMIFYKKDTDGFGILSMLKNMDLNTELQRTRHIKDYKALINHETDAICGYITNEPYYYKKAGVDINIISPSHYGLDLYGDMIFTSEYEATNHPKRVENFKKASIKGWEYALKHKEELIKIIKEKYAKNKSIEHLRYEAFATEEMIQPKSIPIGTLDKGRIKYTLQEYKKHGLIKNNFNINNYIFEPFYSKITLNKEEKEWIKKHPNIKLRTYKYQKPIIFLDNNEVKGIIPDYLKILSKSIGTDIQAVAINSNKKTYGLAEIFENVKIDKEYLVTKPYMFTNFLIFASKTDKSKYKNFKDLKYKTVAILKDDEVMKSYFSSFKDINFIYADNILSQISMLQYGEIDAIVGYRSYHSIINEQLYTNISMAFSDSRKIPISIGINTQYEILYNIINKSLTLLTPKIRMDIISKWINNTNTQTKKFLTHKENSYLKEKKVINMCINPNWMPFEKIENGKHIGMTSDYMQKISNILNIPIKLIPTKEWNQTLEFLKDRKCDITALAMATNDRRKYLDFAKPYLDIPLVIVTRSNELFINNVSSILDRKIGITKGFAYAEILKDKYPNINLVLIDNIKEGLELVRKKELFGFIDSLATTGYHIQKNYIGELKVGGKFDEKWRLGVGTRNDEPILNDIFNKAIAQISPQEKDKILNKWVSVTYDQGINYKPIFQWTGLTIIVFSSIIFIIMKINSKLKKEIRNRKKIEKKLKEISITDELTTLYNRRYFNKTVKKLINSAKRDNQNICFAIMDIDFFKFYNDTYGHMMGDKALKEVSACLKKSLSRADDYCFRLGGEEFGILFKGLCPSQAKKLMEKVRLNIQNLKIPHEKNTTSEYLTASFGLVILNATSIENEDELYKEADLLLYKAKENGRNQIQINVKEIEKT